ncbi:amino acid adenylation domain-containing protein [Streptomyces sp. URMC 129]|uniref:amino acid adenylation domain-containing protein n=1 Tax=Streptomyces sp. URMC 129 TaxID=3423407 RepID=UPI003F19E0EC
MNELPLLPLHIDTRLLSAAEEFHGTETRVPDTCAHLLVARHAASTPDAVAVSTPEGRLTYRQLDDAAEAVAAWLSAQALGEESPVAVLGERNADFLAAMLGIWKAGAAYLPLDPAWPLSRSAEVLRQADCSLVLTTSAPAAGWDREGSTPARLVPLRSAVGAAGAPAASAPGDPDRLAYVIFTSGSTGRPKGAMVEHRGMLNHLFAKVDDLGLGVADLVVQNASQAFDISVWQFLAPLIAGGSVRIVADDVAQDPALLLREADEAGATVLEVVPSMLRMMLELLESSARLPGLGRLRWLLATGETLPPDLCRRWLALYPRVPVLNAYGPTECSDDVTHHVIDAPPASGVSLVPIGRPVANMRVYALRGDGGTYRLCAPGEEGELFVAGPGVGRGYLGDPEATRRAFFRDPFRPEPEARLYRTGDLVRMREDRVLEYLGRTDRQLKVRGYRVQPEEIEAALREHPGVKEAAVALWQGGGGDGSDGAGGSDGRGGGGSGTSPRLVAFVQPRRRNSPTLAGRPRHALPNGMEIARHTRSEVDFLYADIFERDAYTKHGLSIRPGDCVVDVGGNIGLFSLFAHEQSQGGRIYAFEPVPELFELLRENLRLYDVNARVYQYGLAENPGSTTITYYPGFSTLSGLYPDDTQDKEVALSYVRHRRSREPELAVESAVEDELIEGLLEHRFRSHTREIALSTLSDVITENEIGRIDFLKINVEGAELDVLRGIRPGHWPRISQVALEIHDVDGRLREVRDILKAQGFAVGIEQDWSLEQSMRTNFYVYARRPEAARPAEGGTRSSRSPAGYRRARVLTDAQLRAFLRERLPGYMDPAEYRFVERLPLTSTGKLDRRRLEQDGADANLGAAAVFVAPRTEVERVLAAIWQDILGRDRIGVHDNFFDQGGHSLLGARLLARVRTALGPELPLKTVFEHPTVAELAGAVEAARHEAAHG